MCTTGALLGYMKTIIPVDYAIGAGIGMKTKPASGALFGVNDN
jgi:hypothetical protein